MNALTLAENAVVQSLVVDRRNKVPVVGSPSLSDERATPVS